MCGLLFSLQFYLPETAHTLRAAAGSQNSSPTRDGRVAVVLESCGGGGGGGDETKGGAQTVWFLG